MKNIQQNPTWGAGLALYIHWPFCEAKCPYCDFNSHVRLKPIDQNLFGKALIQELRYQSQKVQKRSLTSIFFGGGTPSLMEPSIVEHIIKEAENLFGFTPNIEITLEANPGSSEVQRFADYKNAGINRLSIGVQSFNDDVLHSLGRIHDKQQAQQALRAAEKIFSRYSFDMIYTRQGQSLREWKQELQEALSYAREHISLYQLTIESGTHFYQLHQKGLLTLPDDDASRSFYDLTQEECEKAGFPAYEISNHSSIHAESRHNLVYWRYGEYLGIGPGAHGRILMNNSRIALHNERNPEKWLQKIKEYNHACVEQNILSPFEQAEEYVMMGMRLREGISPEIFKQLSNGISISTTVLSEMISLGFIEHYENKIRATCTGFPVLNRLVSQLTSNLQ